MKTAFSSLLALAFMLSGCEAELGQGVPGLELPSAYRDAGAPGAGAGAPAPDWWRAFGDAQLDALEGQVDAANPDLAAALASYEASQARVREALSAQAPEVDAGVALSANQQSDNRPLRSKTQPNSYGANQIATLASYELDVWGRVRDLVLVANANAAGNADALAEAHNELHAELARQYVRLRGADEESALLRSAIDVYRQALDITRSRVNGAIASPIDVERAQTQLSVTDAQLSELSLDRAHIVDAIAVLVGKAAPEFSLALKSRPLAEPRRPRATPGDVLRRRPDVARSESQVEAASANIGVANAALYPRFTIGLLGGTQDTSLRLFDIGNAMYTVGPSVSVPLFDGGLREGQVDESRARYREAVAAYRASVLKAVRDVQDSLVSLRWIGLETQQIHLAAESAKSAADRSMTLYRDGAVSYLDVVTAQTAALDAERRLIALHTRALEANIGLMLSLGGGWVQTEGPAKREEAKS